METTEGFLFTVIGNVHPQDRVIAYLKNIPSKEGAWGRDERRYRRALKYYTIDCVIDTLNFLTARYPHYIHRLEAENVTFSSVPLRHILQHHRPEEAWADIASQKRLDPLKRRVVELAQILSKESNIPPSHFGVTGSILVGIHNLSFSDIDLVVYTEQSSRTLKEKLRTLIEDDKGPIRRLKGSDLEEWCRMKEQLYPVTRAEARMIYRRKWNRGRFRDVFFSIHPVKIEDEIDERYEDRVMLPIGIVEAEGQVVDASQALFMPAIYSVKEVQITSGPDVRRVEEVVTYEGLYGDLVRDGEFFVCRGKLERVTDRRRGRTYHRILIGSSEGEGGDYIKPVNLQKLV